jgi:hypothetical protein
MYSPTLFPPADLFTAAALTVSGGATPSLTSDPMPVERMSKVYVYVKNTGASTNCTITIKGKPTASSTVESVLAVFTLGASGSGSDKAGRYIEQFPGYIYAVITNSDPANAATITVTVERWR